MGGISLIPPFPIDKVALKVGEVITIKNILTAMIASLALISGNVSAELQVDFLYLSEIRDQGPVLSNILPPPADQGIRGAELAVNDSNTTGRFLKHSYSLTEKSSQDAGQLIDAASEAYKSGNRFFLVDGSSALLTQLAETLPEDALLFNASNPDDQLRTQECHASVFHTSPSRAMLTDALAQWIKARKLKKVLLIRGEADADIKYTDAFKRAAKRFGLKLVDELVWNFDTDLRRAAQRELPLFTQTDEYDLVVVADEAGDFGEYVPFNTWYPRPVAGTQGLTPVAWHRVVEQWGAAQLQSRFEQLAGRWMNSVDYAAWLAVRAVSESVTRTTTNDSLILRDYLLSDTYQLAAFKGRKLTFRGWNHQLRQPIPIVHPRALVSLSPQEGFLHPVNELDTLGFDRPESRCALDKN